MSPTVLERAARQHYEELLAEANLRRLRKEAAVANAPRSHPLPVLSLVGKGVR